MILTLPDAWKITMKVQYICIWSWWAFCDLDDDHHDEAADDGDDHHDDAVDDGDDHAIHDEVDKMTREGGGCLPLSANDQPPVWFGRSSFHLDMPWYMNKNVLYLTKILHHPK